MAEDIVGKVINFFSGDSTENLSDKEIVLRQRLKELSENKYSKFFRVKTDEADLTLGQFFYSLYKMILPIRAFMKDLAKTTRLRQVVLESFMDASIIETVKRLNPAAIEERIKTTSPDDLTAQIQQDIDRLTLEFNSNRINGVNNCYNLVMSLFQLANYDYPTLIKKFDPNFTEGPYGADPKFVPAKSGHVANDLAEFLAVSQGITPDSDWKTILKLIRICAGEDIIAENQFAQLLVGLRDVVSSRILHLIAQYGSKNPVLTCRGRIPNEHIADAWLEARTIKANDCINRINTTEKNKQISALLSQIFFGGDLERLDFYTVSRSEHYTKRDLTGFTYAEGLNYLSVFLSEYVGKDINDLMDILLIRGQWTNNSHSKELSEVFHLMHTLPDEISQLDSSLSDDGVNGSRLKASMLRIDRDTTQIRYINTIMDSINAAALEILENATQHLSIMDKHLKNLSDDTQKKHPELIINWKELNSVSKKPLLQEIAENSMRVNCFVQLMRLCSQ